MVTLAIYGEVTPGAILTKCGLWGDMVDVITCAICRDCQLRGVGVVRGVSLPSPIDFTRRPYNTGHTTCDRVIVLSRLDRGKQSATVMSLFKRGRNDAHTCNCLPPFGGYASCWRTCSPSRSPTILVFAREILWRNSFSPGVSNADGT